MFRTEIPHFFPPNPPFITAGKRSRATPKNLALLCRYFDENLLVRLKTLDPPSLSLFWISLAVDLLSSTHADAKTLISDLGESGTDKSLAWYLDDSVKVLDVCNSISSEIERLRQGRLLIHFILHLLAFPGGDRQIPGPDNLRRARESLSDWAKGSPGNHKRSLQNSVALIRDLVLGLADLPRGKISNVRKVLHRTVYAVGVVTVFVASVAVSVLAGLPETVGIRVPGEFLWSEIFNDLQSSVSGEINRRLADGEKKKLADEVDAVETCVRRVADVIDDVVSRDVAADVEKDKETLERGVKELEAVTERFSDGLDRLLNGVDGFFRAVLCTRNAMLENFREVPEKRK
eukprot:TRINITY_DN902_c0_g1_i1.p1 TRINITY_DN902_c0_g1~~TRINITY_DN902_c0_g1_i1.p1  ORF type:complete len:347 (-),score=14.97 TRINITY_DN902_c0_g1_i1:44-1084(-)